jgi:hypothetical protein
VRESTAREHREREHRERAQGESGYPMCLLRAVTSINELFTYEPTAIIH